MPDYRRLYIPGGTYFFTVNLHDRSARYLTENIHHLRAAWRDVMVSKPFETLAAVVLPDHMHMLWTLPEGDADFSTRLRLIKAGFTRRLPEGLKATGRKGTRRIWQNRFWEHAIRDERDLETHVDYIHFNPVRHGYVKEIADWPFSTWHRFHPPADNAPEEGPD